MSGLAACLGLFSSALIASTLFPAQSELVLAGLLIAGKQPAWLLIVVATVGNVLGSAINWWLGRYLEHFRDRRGSPFTAPFFTAASDPRVPRSSTRSSTASLQ